MAVTVKLVLEDPAMDILSVFTEAARRYRDPSLTPQVRVQEDGKLVMSFGEGTVTGTIKDDQLVMGEPLTAVARGLSEGFGALAGQFGNLPEGTYLVTRGMSQEYQQVENLYRYENGQVSQPCVFFNGFKLG